MCFRKNGISGWRAFFASDEWIEEHYKEKPGAMEKLYGPSQEVAETSAVHEPTKVEEPATDNANVEEAIPEPATPEVEKSIPVEPKKKQRQSFKFKWWHAIVGVVAIIALFFLYLLVKPYPDYLETFSEKWNYAFNKPNNSVARRLFDEAMTHHPDRGFAVRKYGKVEFKLSSDVYREKDLYNGVEMFALTGNRIKEQSEILDTCLYLHHIVSPGVYSFEILSGRELLKIYDSIKAAGGLSLIDPIIPFSINEQYRAEKELMDIVADIPITDAELAEDVHYYYLDYKNLTLLREYFDKNYKYNEDNLDFLKEYTDVLLYTGQYDKAGSIAQSMLKKNKKEPTALSVMAYVAFRKDNWDDARSYAQKAVDYGTDNADAYYILAEALYKLGSKQEAQRYYNIGYEKGITSLYFEFKEAAGCPVKINSIEFAFTDYNGNIITDYGKTLYSSRSQYITPRLNVTTLRSTSTSDIFQCCIICNGQLQVEDGRADGYTFDSPCNLIVQAGYTGNIELTGWGSSYSGFWPSGNYSFQVYYRGELIGKESFYIY